MSRDYIKKKTKFENLNELIEKTCHKYSQLTAFQNMGTKLSFNKIDELSKAFASYLQNNTTLKEGDRIAIQMPNILQYPIALFGALRAGLVVVNINPLYTPQEMMIQLKDSNAKAIVILENFAKNLEIALTELNLKQEIIITELGDMLGSIKGFIVNKFIKYIKKLTPRYNLANTIKFKKTLKIGKNQNFVKPFISGENLAFLQYTGGTTGVAKGAMLTHNNILSNVNQFYEWTKIKLIKGIETKITPLPLYHIMSLTSALCMFHIGAKNILITNPRAIKKLIKTLKKNSFTMISGVNTLFKALLNTREFSKVNFSKCKIVFGGGASIQEAVAKKWKKITGTDLVEAYGLTEASPGVIANPIDGKHRFNSVGIPLPNTEIKIVDEQGREVQKGNKGELLVKGPQVMKGYWNKAEETEQIFNDGWLKTGDIAKYNNNGYISIVDRKKEVVIVSGFNVYPNEVDSVVCEHPKVLEAGSIGVHDDRTGEALKLFVVKKDASLTKEDIISYCETRLTRYKIPKFIEFRSELPKTPVGKILKRKLKEMEDNKDELMEVF